MKLILSCLITALLTFLVGISADTWLNPDYYKTRCSIDYRLNLPNPHDKPTPEIVLTEIYGLQLSSQRYDKVQRDIFKFAPACKQHRPFRPAKKSTLK
jgi:hypothetical protein